MTTAVLVESPAAAPKRWPSWPVWLLLGASILAASASGFFALSGIENVPRWLDGYLTFDATARLFVFLINLIFCGVATYVWSRVRVAPRLREGLAKFSALVLAFMAAANVAVLSNHFLGGWLFLELTTLAAAPLVIRRGRRASLLASWHYLLFSSVGLGLALLGFAFVARGLESSGAAASFFIDRFRWSGAPNAWVEIGLSLLILGYGTKLGLAPMYAWLPEAYDDAPPSVTALLAAVQFNCALVGLFRVIQALRPAAPGLVSSELVALGLLSMAVSSFSIIATNNYKRLLAFASINHAGVIAIGLGVGKSASYGLLLYVVSNAFIKAILFLTAGKVKAHYGTKDMREVHGLIKDLPYTGLFLMVGTFALLGLPPFGSFLGELIILSELVRADYLVVFTAFCALLTITFVATARSIFPMIWAEPKVKVSWPRESVRAAVPRLVFLGALVSMGLYLPPAVSALFRAVAGSLGGP